MNINVVADDGSAIGKGSEMPGFRRGEEGANRFDGDQWVTHMVKDNVFRGERRSKNLVREGKRKRKGEFYRT